jgi:RNA polymerase sigma factor (sigma-70 family)
MQSMAADDARRIEQDRRIAAAVAREWPRLRAFIRRRVPDPQDAEDVLQDVFSEALEAYRGTHPVELLTGWFYRVARNRIVDLFRRRRPASLNDTVDIDEGARATLEDLLPSPVAGPDAEYARHVMVSALEDAIDDLPSDQRDVFIAHEIQGRSFKALAHETGVSINTLLSRKRYAVLRLRERLQDIYDDLTEG